MDVHHVSARQLEGTNLAAELAAVLTTTDLDPSRVYHGITETEIPHDPVAARAVLLAVTEPGVRSPSTTSVQ